MVCDEEDMATMGCFGVLQGYLKYLILVQTMLDCRQNVLASINNILRRITRFDTRHDDKQFNRFISALTTEVQLLRNDLILIFNQNFYLRCKLDQREQQLQAAQKQLSEVTQRMELALQMTRAKYEKQIHALKFTRFLGGDPMDAPPHPPQSHSSLAKPSALGQEQKQQQFLHNLATVKKQKEYNEYKPSPVKQPPQQQKEVECEFDLQLRGLLSEQQGGLFSNNRLSEEMVRSNEMEQQHSKKRRGRGGSSKKEENASLQRKKKSEELAQLVAMQFKVQPIKEKYFSTDLL